MEALGKNLPPGLFRLWTEFSSLLAVSQRPISLPDPSGCPHSSWCGPLHIQASNDPSSLALSHASDLSAFFLCFTGPYDQIKPTEIIYFKVNCAIELNIISGVVSHLIIFMGSGDQPMKGGRAFRILPTTGNNFAHLSCGQNFILKRQALEASFLFSVEKDSPLLQCSTCVFTEVNYRNSFSS